MKHTLTITCLLALAVVQAPARADDYVRNAKEIVAAADWESMRTLTVEIDEHEYEPEVLRLRAGQPYRLELKNLGEEKHYFVAPEFYRAIATRKVQANGLGEVKAPYFTALEMAAEGGQLDLYFVPVEPGRYPVYCTIDTHRDDGMEGWIVVE